MVLDQLPINPAADFIPQAEALEPEARQCLARKLASFFQQLRWTRQPRIERAGTHVDMRQTFRDFMRHGGALCEVHFHRRTRQKKLIVLVDCRESTAPPGLAVLMDAIRRTDPHILLISFDFDVHVLQFSSVVDVERQWAKRHAEGRRAGRRFLDLGDFDLILRRAGRFMPSPTQAYLLILSDLYVTGDSMPADDVLANMRRRLEQFRKTWWVDTLPVGPPQEESENGAMVRISARALRQMLDREKDVPPNLRVRMRITDKVWDLTLSQLERCAIRDQDVLKARRFTPQIRQMGFAPAGQARADSRLTYYPHNRLVALADVFRQAVP